MEDSVIRALVSEEKALLLVDAEHPFFSDKKLTRFWPGIRQDDLPACLAWLRTHTSGKNADPQHWVLDPQVRVGAAKVQVQPGIWRGGELSYKFDQPNPQDPASRDITLNLYQDLAFGWIESLLAAGGKAIDWSEARLEGEGKLTPLSESFAVEFHNLNPAKLDAILTELRTTVPTYTNPTIVGNVLTGEFEPIRMRGYQEADGSGTIWVQACKGGRNFGNLATDGTADRVKVWTAGNVTYTEFVYYYRQTYTEMAALLLQLELVTGALGTAGVSVQHSLRERDEGGPYDLTVEIRTEGAQTIASRLVEANAALTVKKTQASNAATEPTVTAATGKLFRLVSQKNAVGKFDYNLEEVEPQAQTIAKRTVTSTALATTELTQAENAAAEATFTPAVGKVFRLSSKLNEVGKYDYTLEEITAAAVDTGWIEHPGRWGTDWVRGFANQTSTWLLGLKDEAGTKLAAGLDVAFPMPHVEDFGKFSGVIVVRTPQFNYSNRPAADWANFTIKNWYSTIPERMGNQMRFVLYWRGLIHSTSASTCAAAVNNHDNAEVIPINGGKHFEGRYQDLIDIGNWATGDEVPERPTPPS